MYVCLPLVFWYLWRWEVDVIFPATGNKDGCELMWMLGIKSRSPRNVTSALSFLQSLSFVWSCLCLTLLLGFVYYSFLTQGLRWPRPWQHCQSSSFWSFFCVSKSAWLTSVYYYHSCYMCCWQGECRASTPTMWAKSKAP